MDPAQIRKELVEILERELLGPAGGEEEELNDSPRSRYLVGMLARAGERMSPEATESYEAEGAPEDPGSSERPPARATLFPSSMGFRVSWTARCGRCGVSRLGLPSTRPEAVELLGQELQQPLGRHGVHVVRTHELAHDQREAPGRTGPLAGRTRLRLSVLRPIEQREGFDCRRAERKIRPTQKLFGELAPPVRRIGQHEIDEAVVTFDQQPGRSDDVPSPRVSRTAAKRRSGEEFDRNVVVDPGERSHAGLGITGQI